MKKILFFFLFIASGEILFGQEFHDVIYLKNGEIVKGILVNEDLNVSATILNQKGDTLTFQMSDIQKLTRENLRSNVSSEDQMLKPGYELTIEVAKAIGVGEFGIDYYQADIINGVRLSSYIFTGFGIGLTYINDSNYDYYQRPKTIVPVYLDLRIKYPLSKKFSPYLAFDFGGSFNKTLYIDDEYFTDFLLLLKTSFGTHILISQNLSLNIAIGFRSQEMPFTHILYPGRNANGIHTDMNFSNSVNIITGIAF